jgi:hypothetical protein
MENYTNLKVIVKSYSRLSIVYQQIKIFLYVIKRRIKQIKLTTLF